MHYYPVIQISETSIIQYYESTHQLPRTQKQIETEKNLRDIKYLGYMSRKTRSKCSKMLATWINSVRFYNSDFKRKKEEREHYISFFTATLPQQQKHTDNEIKRLALNRLLVTLKHKNEIKHYFWRAESQENGNIHFHILFDKFIDKDELNNIWNDCLEDIGYNTYGFGEKKDKRAPTTKIHKIEKLNNVEAYICKYCCKSEGYRGIDGRVWGCSDSLRELKSCTIFLEHDINERLEQMAENKEIECFEGDCFKIYKTNGVSFLRKNFYKMFEIYRNHLYKCYEMLYLFNPNEEYLRINGTTQSDDFVQEFGSLSYVQLNLF